MTLLQGSGKVHKKSFNTFVKNERITGEHYENRGKRKLEILVLKNYVIP